MLETLIYPMVNKLSDLAINQWNNYESFKNVRLSVRDRVRREAALNEELLNRLKNRSSIINELSVNALQQVFEMPIPLNKIMDNVINDDVRKILSSNKRSKNWTKNIQNEADLIERLWQRTRIFQICISYQEGDPKIYYLRILNRALARSLEVNK